MHRSSVSSNESPSRTVPVYVCSTATSKIEYARSGSIPAMEDIRIGSVRSSAEWHPCAERRSEKKGEAASSAAPRQQSRRLPIWNVIVLCRGSLIQPAGIRIFSPASSLGRCPAAGPAQSFGRPIASASSAATAASRVTSAADTGIIVSKDTGAACGGCGGGCDCCWSRSMAALAKATDSEWNGAAAAAALKTLASALIPAAADMSVAPTAAGVSCGCCCCCCCCCCCASATSTSASTPPISRRRPQSAGEAWQRCATPTATGRRCIPAAPLSSESPCLERALVWRMGEASLMPRTSATPPSRMIGQSASILPTRWRTQWVATLRTSSEASSRDGSDEMVRQSAGMIPESAASDAMAAEEVTSRWRCRKKTARKLVWPEVCF
mmetsp:Transcript_29496/g.96051  ORF Transcript_29496/g.96051 Transcript_29496/m.96051 type:complete len:382 (-) Transcript_29496:975-2120(-)